MNGIWFLSKNSGQKQIPADNVGGRRVVLCCWWNLNGVIRWKLLSHGSSISAEKYSEQLGRMVAEFRERRHLVDEDKLRMDLQSFSDRMYVDFYREGIYKLPGLWRRVVDTDGG
ncbi:hypothetical protein RB195_011413 [Necator americanus]|uniref:Uncharacterized protein n=1 Tax=Necator americanus TaxID=51031 RepID=A0ABR1D291_NECAM